MKTLKRKLWVVLNLVIFFAFSTKAQTADKCVSQGKFIVDVYYGYHYVVGKLLKNISDVDVETQPLCTESA